MNHIYVLLAGVAIGMLVPTAIDAEPRSGVPSLLDVMYDQVQEHEERVTILEEDSQETQEMIQVIEDSVSLNYQVIVDCNNLPEINMKSTDTITFINNSDDIRVLIGGMDPNVLRDGTMDTGGIYPHDSKEWNWIGGSPITIYYGCFPETSDISTINIQ